MNRRLTGYILAALFIAMAGLQYNDPDPLRWMAIYGAAAIASLLAALDRLHVSVPAVIGGIALVWTLLLVPDVLGTVSVSELFESVQMQNTAVEKGREMGGLLIVTIGMVTLLVMALPKRAM